MTPTPQDLIEQFNELLAGAIRTAKRLHGPELDDPRPVVLARIEDERSDFPPEFRIDRNLFDELIATYDPDRRQAPVLGGFSYEGSEPGGAKTARMVAGSGHWEGQYLPPLGVIRGDTWHLDRDHLNLFGQVRQIIDNDTGLGRIDRMVTLGFQERSIAFQPESNETGGRADLVHFALLGGETPGIPNMPSLARTFGLANRSRDWRALGLRADAVRELNYRTLSIFDRAIGAEDMNEEERAAFAAEVATATGAEVSKHLEALNVSLGERLDPLSKAIGGLTSFLEKTNDTAEGAADDAAEAKAAAKAAEEEATRQRGETIRQRLTNACRSGKVSPAQIQRLEKTILDPKTPPEAVELSLALLEDLPEVNSNGGIVREFKVEGSEEPLRMSSDEIRRYFTTEPSDQVAGGELEKLARVMGSIRKLSPDDQAASLSTAIVAEWDGADGALFNLGNR